MRRGVICEHEHVLRVSLLDLSHPLVKTVQTLQILDVEADAQRGVDGGVVAFSEGLADVGLLDLGDLEFGLLDEVWVQVDVVGVVPA